MKTVEEIRRQRLDMLRQEDKFGSWAALNAALGLARRDSNLNQISRRQPRRNKDGEVVSYSEMGAPLARRLEKACGKPEGWMDTDPDQGEVASLSEKVLNVAQRLERFDPKTRDALVANIELMIHSIVNPLGVESGRQSGAGGQ